MALYAERFRFRAIRPSGGGGGALHRITVLPGKPRRRHQSLYQANGISFFPASRFLLRRLSDRRRRHSFVIAHLSARRSIRRDPRGPPCRARAPFPRPVRHPPATICRARIVRLLTLRVLSARSLARSLRARARTHHTRVAYPSLFLFRPVFTFAGPGHRSATSTVGVVISRLLLSFFRPVIVARTHARRFPNTPTDGRKHRFVLQPCFEPSLFHYFYSGIFVFFQFLPFICVIYVKINFKFNYTSTLLI